MSKSTDFSTPTAPTPPSTTTTSDAKHTGDLKLVKNVPDVERTCHANPRPREWAGISRSRPPDARIHPRAEGPTKFKKPATTTPPSVQHPPGRLYDDESFVFAAGGKLCGDRGYRLPQIHELDSPLNLFHPQSWRSRLHEISNIFNRRNTRRSLDALWQSRAKFNLTAQVWHETHSTSGQ